MSFKIFLTVLVVFNLNNHGLSFKPNSGSSSASFTFNKIKATSDCGLVKIDEEIELNDDGLDPSLRANSHRLMANLSSCLNDQNNLFSSYSTHLTKKLSQEIFHKYFYLNEKTGALYQTKPVDREKLCELTELHSAKLKNSKVKKIQVKKKRDLFYQNENGLDSINCECKSEKCELRFKFNAFRKNPQRSTLNELNNSSLFDLKKSNHHHHHNNLQHRNLLLTILINDLNDNRPRFVKNFLSLNVSENIGVNPMSKTVSNGLRKCGVSRNYMSENNDGGGGSKRSSDVDFINDNFHGMNTLIPLEKAIDLDTGVNSEIYYDLILLNNVNADIDLNDLDGMRSLVNDGLEECGSDFELVETNLDHGGFDSSGEIFKSTMTQSSISTNQQRLIFLKINKFLDREQRDLYNFVLIARDRETRADFLERNFLWIKLVVTDLNDNSPVFDEAKYTFNLNETIDVREMMNKVNKITSEISVENDGNNFEKAIEINPKRNINKNKKSIFFGKQNKLNKILVDEPNENVDAILDRQKRQKIIQNSFSYNEHNKINNVFDVNEEQNKLDKVSDEIITENNSINNQKTNKSYEPIKKRNKMTLFNNEQNKVNKISVDLNEENNMKTVGDINSRQVRSIKSNKLNKKSIINNEHNKVNKISVDFSQENQVKNVVDINSRQVRSIKSNKLNKKSLFNTEQNKHNKISANLNTENYYLKQLKETCANLKRVLRVKAYDKDHDLNGEVKYKLVQQVHRKHPGFKPNFNTIFNGLSDEIGADSLFTIDEKDGFVQLNFCLNLTQQPAHIFDRQKFLELTVLLDYELYTKHNLVIEASDLSKYNPLQTFATVEINLNDLNDNAPHITNLLSSKCPKFGLANDFQSLSQNYHELSNESGHITISIQNLNKLNNFLNHSELLASKIIIEGVSELSQIGRCIGQFLITDLDTPLKNLKLTTQIYEKKNNKFYETSKILLTTRENRDLSLQQTSTNLFATNEIFELFLNFEPDAESERIYEFFVLLKDHQLESLAQIFLRIDDENDNEPKFEKTSYQFQIDEDSKKANLKPSTPNCFAQLKAYDLDQSKSNSLITYELSVDSDIFYIQPNDGFLCVKNRSQLDRETKSIYKLHAKAINKQSNHQLETSVPIEIIIKDQNDNAPEFTKNEYSFFLPEKDTNLVNTLMQGIKLNELIYVGQVLATDRDSGLNAEIKYHLNLNSPHLKNYFQINTNNLDNVYLKEKNLFNSNNDVVSNEDDDIEPGLKSTRLFKIIDNIEELVFVNETTGAIYLIDSVDRELVTNIKFWVFASDRRGGGDNDENSEDEEALRTSVQVTIELIDLNDSKPVCSNLDNLNDKENLKKKPKFLFTVYFNSNNDEILNFTEIYRLDCSDLDQGKNSELFYTIDSVHLKKIQSGRKLINSFSDGQLISGERVFKKLFSIDQKNGVLKLNLMEAFSKLKNYVQNYLFVLRIKVSDSGMIPFESVYGLVLRFCVSNQFFIDLNKKDRFMPSLNGNSTKYCEFEKESALFSEEYDDLKTLVLTPFLLDANDEFDFDDENYEVKTTTTTTTFQTSSQLRSLESLVEIGQFNSLKLSNDKEMKERPMLIENNKLANSAAYLNNIQHSVLLRLFMIVFIVFKR